MSCNKPHGSRARRHREFERRERNISRYQIADRQIADRPEGGHEETKHSRKHNAAKSTASHSPARSPTRAERLSMLVTSGWRRSSDRRSRARGSTRAAVMQVHNAPTHVSVQWKRTSRVRFPRDMNRPQGEHTRRGFRRPCRLRRPQQSRRRIPRRTLRATRPRSQPCDACDKRRRAMRPIRPAQQRHPQLQQQTLDQPLVQLRRPRSDKLTSSCDRGDVDWSRIGIRGG